MQLHSSRKFKNRGSATTTIQYIPPPPMSLTDLEKYYTKLKNKVGKPVFKKTFLALPLTKPLHTPCLFKRKPKTVRDGFMEYPHHGWFEPRMLWLNLSVYELLYN